MKRIVPLLLAVVLGLTMVGCAKSVTPESEYEPESLAGYMVIEDNKLYLDEVEIVTTKDEERIKELGLNIGSDLPNGYHIHNPSTETISFELTDDTIYTFTDFHLLFIEDENSNLLYTTTKKDEFLKHLSTSYSDEPPAQKVPFFIETFEGEIISITEEFIFTQ